MFDKILIANRGEIACRVIRTARRLGIRTVAVYSDADRGAVHVAMADESLYIGPAPSAQSYLSVENLVDACIQSGAQAVHPGYGFLSENAAFVEALTAANIAFIGPGRPAIEAMGDKITSKLIAQKAGVNVIPGYTDVVRDAQHAVEISADIGYPVMIKASAGGGGKGMRVAWDPEQCEEGFDRASSEARSSFGDDRIFIEKFIQQPRHIEIQIIADSLGNVIHLGERECSIQRRHQKVIEESPSPFIDAEIRSAMGAQAIALAKAVDYSSAGTVEFVVDAQRNFYFLEMNTRLQVEHPVTEMVTGLDLVELMIRVASGESLPITQEEVQFTGWAMESRIYAEDSLRGFLPSIGRLVRYSPPPVSSQIRVDDGVYEGGEVSMFYDPMLAKLISYAPNRDEAIVAIRAALDRYYIRGIETNIPFLAALMKHPRFLRGELSTQFIEEEYPDGFNETHLQCADQSVFIAVAAVVHHCYRDRDASVSGQLPGHSPVSVDELIVQIDGECFPVCVRQEPATPNGAFEISYSGNSLRLVSEWRIGQVLFVGTLNDEAICVQVDRHDLGYRLSHDGSCANTTVLTHFEEEMTRLMPAKIVPDLSGFLLSPMPGLLISVAVEVGMEVKAGQVLAVVEAMKMENVLRAERDCIVKAVMATVDDNLTVDQKILEFE